MRQARKIKVSDSIIVEVGVNDVDHINIMYPLARIYSPNNAIPTREIILPIGAEIEWLKDAD